MNEISYYVEGPDGKAVTSRYPTSGEALMEACRHYRPRLIERKPARTYDWQEMKENGYKLIKEWHSHDH